MRQNRAAQVYQFTDLPATAWPRKVASQSDEANSLGCCKLCGSLDF